MPDTLEGLFPEYLSGSMDPILHPGEKRGSMRPFHWLYFPRPKLDGGDPKDILLASLNLYDPKEGSKMVRVVVRYDGSGNPVPDADYQRQITAQRAK
ncbi:MAG: hypothetical protein ABI680_04945 [Chthoniobacteraceae bacterium]